MGWGEIALIAVLILVFVGPDDLPKLLRFLGRNYGKLRRASDDLRRTFTLEVDKVDAEARAAEIQRRREELLARRKQEAERYKEQGGAFPRDMPAKRQPDPPEHTQAAEDALNKLAQKPTPSDAAARQAAKAEPPPQDAPPKDTPPASGEQAPE